jgi:hypothetical protein
MPQGDKLSQARARNRRDTDEIRAIHAWLTEDPNYVGEPVFISGNAASRGNATADFVYASTDDLIEKYIAARRRAGMVTHDRLHSVSRIRTMPQEGGYTGRFGQEDLDEEEQEIRQWLPDRVKERNGSR